VAQTSHLDLTPAQIDALTSFDYNTGDLEQLLGGGARDKNEIASTMLLYRNDANGNRLKGLENRRKAERSLFVNGYPASAADAVKAAVLSMQNKPLR
jgi:GH24 family phage-related lysozyme (muramidase)